MRKVFKLSGLHCVSCALNIDMELEDLGIKTVKTSYPKSEVEVEWEEPVTELKVVQAIEKLGYRVLLQGN